MRTRSFLAAILLSTLGTFTLQAESPAIVDRSTLTGKVMCGYQGWFNCQGDGADLGWTHWSRHRSKVPAPGNVTVDLWPDLSEYDADELYDTEFWLADGSPAKVFSSTNRKTVLRHFEWMQDYGIDGAFVQRFANGIGNSKQRAHKDAVLSHAQAASNQFGRAFAVMYDLSGMKTDNDQLVQQDWLHLQESFNVTKDAAYLNHEGKPLVAIWGIGFSDNRPYTLDYCRTLITWFKQQGCSVMLGVPSFWRDLRRDAVDDPKLLRVLELANVLSPWPIGRYQTPQQATEHAEDVWQKDLAWCSLRGQDFLPVVYPGFSWHNLKDVPLDSIPRRKGEFFWSQITSAKQIGAEMIYVAMFDEVDEGTAIFKCTNHPPVGDQVQFLDYEGLPSDFYLQMTGDAGRLLRGEPVKAQPRW